MTTNDHPGEGAGNSIRLKGFKPVSAPDALDALDKLPGETEPQTQQPSVSDSRPSSNGVRLKFADTRPPAPPPAPQTPGKSPAVQFQATNIAAQDTFVQPARSAAESKPVAAAARVSPGFQFDSRESTGAQASPSALTG